ncbi:MAG: MFS transporter [Colwellia sp.]
MMWIRVLSIYVVLFTQMLDNSVANLSLIIISSDLYMDVFHASWIMTFYGAGLVVALPFAPYFAKYVSSDTVFLVGGILFILSSIACGVVSDANSFLFFRFTQGFSAGLSAVICQGLMIRVMGERHKVFTVALVTSAISLAPVFGPFIGGVITEYLNWRWLFLINVPLMGISLYFIIDILDLKKVKRQPLPYGYLIALFAFAFFILSSQYIFDFGREKSWLNSEEIQIAFVFCLSCLVIFVYFNSRPKCSVFYLGLLKNKDFMITTLILSMGNGVISSSLVLLPIWLQVDYNMPILHAGAIVSVASAVAAILTPIIGKKINSKHYPILSIISLSFTGVSFYIMGQFTIDTPQWEFIIVRLIAGLGLATFTAPLLTLSLTKVNLDKMNEASSLSLSLRLTSSNVCVALAFAFWQNEHIRIKEHVISNVDKFAYQGLTENKFHWFHIMFERVTHTEALTNILSVYSSMFLLAICIISIMFIFQYKSQN